MQPDGEELESDASQDETMKHFALEEHFAGLLQDDTSEPGFRLELLEQHFQLRSNHACSSA